MAAGQSAFWVAEDVAALDVLETRLQVQEAVRCAEHAAMLRTVLELHGLYAGRGLSISTVPHAALSLGCSESRAGALLSQAQGLAELPGGLEAVECALLSVEQSATVVAQLAPLPLPGRLAVWRRLQARLIEAADAGSVLPPARLSELLRRWVMEADQADAVERRQRAEAGRSVDYRLRPDGLGDLFACGFRAPDLHAILSRIAARSAPWGAEDDRTADQRRFDAFKDLLLGRDVLPVNNDDTAVDRGCSSPPCAAGCGCLPGQPVPCGVELVVHVPLGAALGTSDEVAELVGHGPLEPDLLVALLLSAPRLRAVWVGPDGTPVAAGDRVVIPQRGDPQAVRTALLELAAQPPLDLQPRHPLDHRPAHVVGVSGVAAVPVVDTARLYAALDELARHETGLAHPADAPGTYRLPARLRRLIDLRAPRCEWPGCGARAVRCDAEHDLPWPQGPTCACNLGPCCRRHHQVKQQGWCKTRTAAGVRWTSPTGRSWLSPPQHPAPAAPVRSLPAVPTLNPFDELSPLELEDELWALDLLPADTWADHRPPVDVGPADSDRLGHRLLHGDTRWSLDLADPYPWLEELEETPR